MIIDLYYFSQTQPVGVGNGVIQSAGAQGSSSLIDHSPIASLQDLDGLVGGRKMSSFDRIVEKLAPNYPQFHKYIDYI